MRQVPETGRPAVRAWLTEHSYPPKLTVVVRAEHVAEVESVLAHVLVPEPGGEPFEEGTETGSSGPGLALPLTSRGKEAVA